jgi:cell division septation protein DedD
LFFGFAATVTIGLALAIWYVGVRIVAADEVAPPIQTIGAPAISTPPLAATPPVPATPPAPDLYLQIASLGPKQDGRLVRSLQAQGFRAQVEPGPAADDEARIDEASILVGPFSSHAKLEQGRLKLQSGGILAVETTQSVGR